MPESAVGAFCRVHSAPARSIGRGLGVYVSSQSGYELCVGRAEQARGNERGFPHALDFELDILATCAKHGQDDRRFRALLNTIRSEELRAAHAPERGTALAMRDAPNGGDAHGS
jgi:hypothetical protein